MDVTFTVDPEDFQGPDLDAVGLQFRFTSDGAWSDEDCLVATAGAVQIDNIAITLSQGEDSFTDLTDFETGLGNWKAVKTLGVGAFTQIWTGLQDIDPAGRTCPRRWPSSTMGWLSQGWPHDVCGLVLWPLPGTLSTTRVAALVKPSTPPGLCEMSWNRPSCPRLRVA